MVLWLENTKSAIIIRKHNQRSYDYIFYDYIITKIIIFKKILNLRKFIIIILVYTKLNDYLYNYLLLIIINLYILYIIVLINYKHYKKTYIN